ncbi:uncharacterized protein LOC133832512 [Humulus lupulus]|uniref:uncharacterized protein LOC133832512 n=1 Tax=Humulus lupulus TaxID=3486 RepID=UPI002B404655|nr:uncharacterized protein LOC133832512 [Humulus lupulus]
MASSSGSTSSSFNVPTTMFLPPLKLDRSNYFFCKSQVLLAIHAHDLESMIGHVLLNRNRPPQRLPESAGSTTMMKGFVDGLRAIGHPITNDQLILYILPGVGNEYEMVVVNLTSKDPVTILEVLYLVHNHEMRLELNQATSVLDLSGAAANFSQTKKQFNDPPQNNYNRGSQAPYAFVSSPSIVVDDAWNLDNGASNHVTSGSSNLLQKSNYKGKEKLVIGDGSHLSIENIGSNNDVVIEFSSDVCLVKDKISKTPLLQGTIRTGLYHIQSPFTHQSNQSSILASANQVKHAFVSQNVFNSNSCTTSSSVTTLPTYISIPILPPGQPSMPPQNDILLPPSNTQSLIPFSPNDTNEFPSTFLCHTFPETSTHSVHPTVQNSTQLDLPLVESPLVSPPSFPQILDPPATQAQKALSNPRWRTTMEEEYHTLVQNDTWSLVSVHVDMNIVQKIWVFKTKLKSDGTLDKLKVGLVAKGFQQTAGV